MGFATNSRRMERTDQFIGQSLAFLDAVERASRAAPLNRPVLVIGEPGTGKKPISVDVRIVAATNENLPAQVEKGKFRADLLDRLSFEVITLPPLRGRQGDVPLLAEHFGRRMAVELDWSNWPGFTPRAKAALEAYHWPGNVRELRNAVERAVYRHENPERPVDEIQFDPFHSPWAPMSSGSAAAAAPPLVGESHETPSAPPA